MQYRRGRELRFRAYGLASVLFGLLCLLMVFGDILSKGLTAFQQTVLSTDIYLDQDYLGISRKSDDQELFNADYEGLIKTQFRERLGVESRGERRQLYSLLSAGAGWQLRDVIADNPELLGSTITVAVLLDDEVDQWFKHYRHAGQTGKLSERQLQWLQQWQDEGRLSTQFNRLFFTNGDSREPELAGIRGAITGTFLTLLVTLLLSFPIGVAAAIYLEEFAPKKQTDRVCRN